MRGKNTRYAVYFVLFCFVLHWLSLAGWFYGAVLVVGYMPYVPVSFLFFSFFPLLPLVSCPSPRALLWSGSEGGSEVSYRISSYLLLLLEKGDSVLTKTYLTPPRLGLASDAPRVKEVGEKGDFCVWTLKIDFGLCTCSLLR